MTDAKGQSANHMAERLSAFALRGLRWVLYSICAAIFKPHPTNHLSMARFCGWRDSHTKKIEDLIDGYKCHVGVT